jgi:hypothetical protein
MNNATEFDRASIGAVEHRIKKGAVSSRVKVVAIATAKIARAIGARWLLDKDALVKQGFTSVELDYELKNVRVKHAIEKVASLEVVADLVTKFKVFRKGDDKKKAARLMVSFVVHTTEPPFTLLEHLMKVGAGEGACTLVPLQAEMFDTPKEAKPKPSRQKKLPLEPPAAKKRPAAPSPLAQKAAKRRVAKADAKKAARGARLAAKDGADRRLARKKGDVTNVKLNGPKGEVLFEGSGEEFSGAARAVAAGERDPVLG